MYSNGDDWMDHDFNYMGTDDDDYMGNDFDDMDLDRAYGRPGNADLSLLAGEAAYWHLRHPDTQRLPGYGTLRIQEEDEPVTTSVALKAIEASQGRHHRLCLDHVGLEEETVIKILEALAPTVVASDDDKQPIAASKVNTGPPLSQTRWSEMVMSLLKLSNIGTKLSFQSFRIIELDGNDLTSECMPAICALLADNPMLHTLSLSGNDLGGDDHGRDRFVRDELNMNEPDEYKDHCNPTAFIKLARALGGSYLRRLCLSSNPIMSVSLVAFLDSIQPSGTSLECLELSTVLTDDMVDQTATEEEALEAARAVARLIADSQRCRSLTTLSLNGNGFGSRGVRTIINAVVGGRSSSCEQSPVELLKDPLYDAIRRAEPRQPNQSLEHLDLSGNVENGWLPDDLQKEIDRFHSIRQRYASVPADDIPAINWYFKDRARQKRLQGDTFLSIEAPIEVSRQLPSIGVTLDEWLSDFQEIAEMGAGLTSENWKKLLDSHLFHNKLEGASCRRAALAILGPARILGCRASRRPLAGELASLSQSESARGFHKFLDLPPELKLLILRHLDEGRALSAHQFNNVISFACEPSTIGYGQPHFDRSRVSTSDTGSAESTLSSTLPARFWSWPECFALRALPRDWSTDLLDASDDTSVFRSRGLDPVWEYGRVQPGMYAFLESTGTHRADP